MFLKKIKQNWIDKKIPEIKKDTEWKITYKKLFVWITAHGSLFSFMLIAMIIAAINYSNSMAFATAFLLLGIGLVSFHKAYNNIISLSFKLQPKKNCFVGEKSIFLLIIKNKSNKKIYGIEALWQGDHSFFDKQKEQMTSKIVDIEAGGESIIELEINPKERGYLKAPWIIAQTHFPLGLVRFWTWLKFDTNILVYPEPKNKMLLKDKQFEKNTAKGNSLEKEGKEEFSSLRHYIKGDPFKSIDWKSFAKYQKPLVKQFIEPTSTQVWFDWYAIPKKFNDEDKLSILTYFICEAQKQGISYGLILPNKSIVPDPDKSKKHMEECLIELAVF